MAAVTPPYALGRHVAVAVTPLTKSTTGTYATASAGFKMPLQGRVESHSMGVSLGTENISPIHSFNANPVPMELSTRFEIAEDGFASADLASASIDPTKGNVLKAAIKLSFYAKLELSLSDDAGTEIDRITAIGVWTAPASMATEKGRVRWNATLEAIAVFDSTTGNAIANPQFGTSPTL